MLIFPSPRPHAAAAFLKRGAALAVLAAVGLAGCASKNPLAGSSTASASKAGEDEGVQTTKNRRLFGIFSPYRIDIQQGNFVSQEMVAQLKEGMTREQVRFALGTPLLTDLFHANRWDYPFRLQRGNGEVISSRVSVYFQDNLLTRVEGGALPDEEDYLARLSGKIPKQSKKTTSPLVPEAPSSARPPGERTLPQLP